MARYCDLLVLDDGLNALQLGVTHIIVCDFSAGVPTDYTDLVNNKSLTGPTAETISLPLPTGSSDRTITVPSKSAMSIVQGGTADHVALTNGVDKIWYYTPISNPQGVSAGNDVNLGPWDIVMKQPVAP